MPVRAKKVKYTSPHGSKTWEYFAALCCSLNVFNIGGMTGWTSPTLIKLNASDSPIAITTEDTSTLIALTPVGFTLAAFVSNPLIDRLGRKATIFFGAIPGIMSWIMIYIATDVWMLMLAKFLAGLTIGTALCASPIYLGEIASVRIRGAMSSTISVMFNIGLLFAYTIVPRLSIPATALTFLIVSIIAQIALWLTPESPYYLMMSGRYEEAEGTLEKLRGKTNVSDELDQIKMSLEDTNNRKIHCLTSIKYLFTLKKNLIPFIVVTLFHILHHFGGLVLLLQFSHTIFADAGRVISNDTASVAIACTKLISATAATFMVDKVGRKPLILLGGLLSFLSNLAIGGYFYAQEYMALEVSSYSFIPVVAAAILLFAFNIGLVSIPAVLTGELFSLDVKAMSSCMIGVFGGVLGAISGKMYLIIVRSWGLGHTVPFLSFAVVTLLSISIILYLLPETKGKNLAEIQRILAK